MTSVVPIAVRLAFVAAVNVLLFSIVAVAGATVGNKRIGDITAQRLLDAQSEPGEWFTGGRDYRQSYYSPLAQITADNVRKLGFAWSHDIDSDLAQATPIVIDGVMFTSGGAVYSLDAKTGAVRWSFTPQGSGGESAAARRGVSVWEGTVYFASRDGWLYALDADTGSLLWQVDTIVDRERTYFITGAPYIAGRAVVIGNGGAEFDARGYITAYDLATGKQKWRFFTVPGDPKKGFEHPELEWAAKTWDVDSSWEVGGGGTSYDGMAYDPKLNILYVGTGNGIPWNRDIRSPAGGDNLFLSSILAINPDTGRLIWYYQTTPGDRWDYTATQKPILADLKIDGKHRSVIMQAPKNGFFYILDRKSGELLSAKPFAYINWASHVDLTTGRPVLTGNGDYSKGPTLVFPAPQGAHNWYPMAHNPGTGLVYIPVLETGGIFAPLSKPFVYKKKQWNLGVQFIEGHYTDTNMPQGWPSLDALRADGPDPLPRTFLRAWDPIKQAIAWEVETSHGSRSNNPAGVMTTASGLVFQGHADGRFLVFDGKTGQQLHSIDVGNKMVAAPMTYQVDGEQYVAIMSGTSSVPVNETSRYARKGRILAFKLGGGAVPYRPSDEEKRAFARPPVADVGTSDQRALGGTLFANHCAICHSNAGRAPSLVEMEAQAHREFTEIVLGGARLDKGMPGFADVISPADAQAIHTFLTGLAWANYRQSQSSTMPASNAQSTANCPLPEAGRGPVKLLMVTGGHLYDPGEFFAAFSALPNVHYEHVYMASGKPISVPPGGPGQYDAVLFYDLEPKAMTAEWRDLFDRGRGAVFLHHSLASFPDSPEYRAIVGGQYIFPSEQRPKAPHSTFHPNQRQRFAIFDRKHPVTCALSNFDLLDEAYDEIDVDPTAHVLMRSDFPKRSGAAAWISGYTDKRVIYIQPGHGSLGLPLDHGPSSYQSDSFMKLLERAILWAAGRI